MSTGSTSVEQVGAAPAPAAVENSEMQKAPTQPAGVSAFVAKVLDQLSLSAWLPATLFAVSVTILAKFKSRGDIDLAAVVESVSKDWVTIIVWTAPVLLISVLVIQASSFAAIQFLEGYGAARGPGRWCRSGLIRRQTRRLARLERRVARARRLAFDESADRWADEAPEVVMALRASAYGLGQPDLGNEHRLRVDDLVWETECDSWRLAQIAEMEQRLEEFPARHRLLPTRLGNVLRATEDALEHERTDVSQFALRRRSLVPARVQAQHDQFRQRLDMYATLTVVSVFLSALSFVLVTWGGAGWQRGALVAVPFAAFAVVSYRASVASARGYCAILRVMDTVE